MNAERVAAIASAVLYEGYVLYPYRASSQKNQLRWQFGVLAPPAAAYTPKAPVYEKRLSTRLPDASSRASWRFSR